ncbi:MAG: TonB-dependent receptor [Prolixibacteraceae bacterium]
MIKIMRFAIFILFLSISQSFAFNSYSQQTKVSLEMINVKVEAVIDKLEQKTDFFFLYNKNLIDVDRIVSIKAQNEKIDEVLDKLFHDTGISYQIKDRQILLINNKLELTDDETSEQKTVSVSGRVTDSSGAPVPGVTVLIKGTTLGTVTNANGMYNLSKVPDDAILQYSFVGMKTQEINVRNKTSINVVLSEETIGLNEVVAVGYGIQRKRDISGAISSIKADDVKAGVVTNTAQILKGRAAGVYVRQNSSEPGGGISIRIRGTSSISSNNEPLYVIDGFPTELGKDINPGDIESIEILKDAAATAIYGARGANGVILITTKQGKNGVFNVNYTYDQSFKDLYNPFDLKNAQDIMQFNIKQAIENGTYGTNPPYTEEQLKYKGKGTDWLDLTTRTAITQNHQLSITGGQDKLKMAIIAGYLNDQGILENTSFDRFTGRMNMEYKLNDRVNFGSNIYMARSDKNFQNMGTRSTVDNVIYNILLLSPMSVPEGGDVFGNPGKVPQILKQLYEPDIENVGNDYYSSIFGDADILMNLKGRVQFTYGNSNSKNQQYYPKTTNTGKSVDGLAIIENYKDDKYQLDALLTFHQKIAKIHDVKIIAGSTYSQQTGEGNGMTASGFATDEFSFNNIGAGKNIQSIYSNKWRTTKNSYFARTEYVLNDKYIVNLSLRADGASNFGKGNKWGYFPAISTAWQIGDERWMDFSKSLFSNIKLRASYGITGNDGIGTYLSLAKFGYGSVYLGGDGVQKGMFGVNPANADLKWEQTAQLDFGADFTMLKDRIQVNFDYYKKTTSDLLNPILIPISTQGFSSVMGNNGKIENKGFELYLKTTNISKPNFSWSSTLNLSKNKNKILDLNNNKPHYESIMPQGWYNLEEYSILQQGYPLSTIYGYVFDGIIQKGETYSPQPKSVPGDPKFKDITGDGLITADDRDVIGNGNPDIVIGLGNTISFHNLDFSFFFDSNLGNQLFNVTKLILEDADRTKNTFQRWTQQNPSTEIPRNGYQKDDGLQYGSYVNSRFVEDASFLRLTNIDLGYTLPFDKISPNYKLARKIRVAVGAQNLFTITKYTGFNPEVSTNGGSATTQGLDFSSYPAYRSYYFSVKLTF